MRIIHLSDFHYDKETAKDSSSIRDQLIKKINDINEEEPIDLILFSGDLVNQAGNSFGSLKLAFDGFKMFFIDPILKKLDYQKLGFFLQ